MSVSEDQKTAVVEEVYSAIYLIEFGLLALNELANAEHLPVLLLSNGFERLLKMILCLNDLEQEGQLPTASSFSRNRNHDIDRLLKQVIDIAKQWNCEERYKKSAKADMDFLEQDRDLERLVPIQA